MTVAEIKEYIDERIKECDKEYEHHDRQYGVCLDHRDVSNELEKVKDMLDELEDRPKAKWEEVKFDIDIASRYECSNCHCLSHSKSRFCADCGAKMNDEVEENK